MDKKFRILVVEDNPAHVLDAETAADAAGVEIVVVTDARNGLDQLAKGAHDAVVTDIYLPYDEVGRYSDPNAPTGLVVAAKAASMGIPFALCTAGYHHGTKYEWVTKMCGLLGWSVVESGYWERPEEEAPRKDWARAFASILWKIDNNKK